MGEWKDKAKQKVKSIELMYFLFSSRMWYTPIERTVKSVDLIMKSIIFLFEVGRHYFLRSSNSADDKLVLWWRRSELWSWIVEKISN
jgi:hypothetical protein